MKILYDERGFYMTISQLKESFENLRAENPDEYDYSFQEYLRECTSKNGTLEIIVM